MDDELPSGDFYVISDYGYGDGHCYGPMTAREALAKYCEIKHSCTLEEMSRKGLLVFPYRKYREIELFNGARYSNRIHYIGIEDKSQEFQNFPDS